MNLDLQRIYRGAIAGALGGLAGWALISLLVRFETDRPALLFAKDVVLGALIGLCIGLAIGAVEQWGDGWASAKIRRVLLSGVIGLGAGALGLAIGEIIFLWAEGGVWPRTVGWAIFGLLLGVGQGPVTGMPTKGFYAGLGGFLGGLVGGATYERLSLVLREVGMGRGVALTVGAAIGLIILGACLGLFMALFEGVLRRAWLRFQHGPLEGRTFTLDNRRAETTIGRADHCNVMIRNAPEVQPVHAVIRPGIDGLYLAAREGALRLRTASGDQPVTQRLLHDGDVVQIGRSRFVFQNESIASGLRNEYALTYRSATPYLDGTRRNLEAQISAAAGNLNTVGSYSVGGIISSRLNLWVFLPTLLFLSSLLIGLLWAPQLAKRTFARIGPASDPQPDRPSSQRCNDNNAPEADLLPRDTSANAVTPSPTPVPASQAALAMELLLAQPAVTLGNRPDCTYQLADPSVASIHARLTREGPRWVVEDLTGAGRALVSYGGEPSQLRPTLRNALRHGSLIRMGDMIFTFYQPEGGAPQLERRIPLIEGAATVIGATPRSTIRVAGADGVEAQVQREGARWTVTPVGGVCQVSYTGDPVQFRPIKERNALRSGSRILLGSVMLRLDEDV